MNDQGDKLWDKIYDGESNTPINLIQTVDGGYVMAGYTIVSGKMMDLWIIKRDEEGNPGKVPKIDESGNIVKGLEEKTLKKIYALRDTGPAGGHIFYDKGSYSDGWRYLEAAPMSTEAEKQWGSYYQAYILKTEWNKKQWSSYETLMRGTGTGIGTGQSNTTIIIIVMTWLNRTNSNSETDNAAQLCYDLTEGGYSDWFYPREMN